jgi:PLP dependent protein
MTIRDQLFRVREQIQQAELQAGRAVGSVQLLAVSKLHPVSSIREAYEAGQREFGENYVQELQEKRQALRDLPDLRFHLIGHLQSNKVKIALECADVIQTIDSIKIIESLGKRAGLEEKNLPIMIEINIGQESQKHGASPDSLPELMAEIAKHSRLQLRGLMTVPPHTDDPEGARPYLAALRTLREQNGGEQLLPELSMGMSHDMQVAVSEGATMVRIGTAIFGARPS